jgi:hypothetical protein
VSRGFMGVLSYLPNASTHGPATIQCSSPATVGEG